MDFLRASEVPHRYGDLVFREGRITKAIAFLVLLALTVAALAAALFPELIPLSDPPPRLIVFLVAGTLLLMAMVSLYTVRASLRSSNWLVRFDRRKLYIKFRSYLNALLPDDPVVAALEPGEIEWIRKTTVKRVMPGRRRRELGERWTYLDLGVSGDTAQLKEHLRKERRREAPMVRRTRTKAEHYPVRVPEPGVIRVEWKGPRTRIRAIAILGRRLRALPELRLHEEGIRDLDPEEAEAQIRKHVESGEILAAAKLARRLYGVSLTEARDYIDQLRER